MIDVEREEGWARIRLNRPEAGNALNGEVVSRLLSVLEELRADGALRAVVLTGTGKLFCAGADLNEMKRTESLSVEQNLRDAERSGALFIALHEFPGAVIAAVNGPARGGGVGLVAACDFAIACTTASFAFTEVRIGIVPALISPFVLRKMGESRTRRLFLSGETFGAEQAAAWGLVDRAVAPEEFESAVQQQVALLRACAPGAIAQVKRLIREVGPLSIAESVPVTARLLAESRTSAEAQEGMAAFLEKRPPRWAR